MKKIGYHLKIIDKGEFGEFSKIKEEFEELADAVQQKCKILQMVELCDLLGAIEGFALKKYNLHMEDLLQMKELTKRSFENGERHG